MMVELDTEVRGHPINITYPEEAKLLLGEFYAPFVVQSIIIILLPFPLLGIYC